MSPGATARPARTKAFDASQRIGSRERLIYLENAMNEPIGSKRRRFLKQATAAGLMSLVPGAVRTGAWAAGSDAPEKKEVKIGFIPLTDCASVVMASVLGFDKKYGVKITPSKEASWAAIRDKVVNGELDAAHVLYGLIYGVHLGVGGTKKDMAAKTEKTGKPGKTAKPGKKKGDFKF